MKTAYAYVARFSLRLHRKSKLSKWALSSLVRFLNVRSIPHVTKALMPLQSSQSTASRAIVHHASRSQQVTPGSSKSQSRPPSPSQGSRVSPPPHARPQATLVSTTPDDSSHTSSILWQALVIILAILRHVLLSIAFVWFTSFYLSKGNFASGKPPSEQSYCEFFMVMMQWNYFHTVALLIISQSLLLKGQRFTCCPDRRATFWFCCKRLFWATLPAIIVCDALTLLISRGISCYAVTVSPIVLSFKLEFYGAGIVTMAFMASVFSATSVIYRNKTVQGQARHAAQPIASSNNSTVPASFPSSRFGFHFRWFWSSTSSFRKALTRSGPRSGTVVLAGAYVHVSSRLAIERPVDIVLFTAGSLLLKLALQELAKWYVIRRAKGVRTMYVAVALPTILIDTQVRLVLQRLQTAQATYSGIMLMTLVEFCLRLGRLLLLKWQLVYHRSRRTPSSSAITSATQQALTTTQGPVIGASKRITPLAVATAPNFLHVARTRTKRRSTTRNPARAEMSSREERLLHFHAAESYADMTAEYIAIGSCSAVLYFFGNHPIYALSWLVNSTSGSEVFVQDSSHYLDVTDTRAVGANDGMIRLGVQVGVELMVDFICCGMEIWSGIDYRDVHRQMTFLTIVLVLTSIVNIQISAAIYTKNEL